ncbi:MAG: TIGR04086 family membrane protein [Clostridia bacterium]|nr:TIGR04086 family membrane protein [Clostridia bacterium]
MTNSSTLSGNNKNMITALLKGSFIALLISLVGILIFALFLKFVDINDSWIMPINQVIKVLSIFFGVKSFLKNCEGKGLIKGALLGLVYTLFAFVVFSLLSSSFVIDLTLVYDSLFGTILGAICGIICVSIKK